MTAPKQIISALIEIIYGCIHQILRDAQTGHILIKLTDVSTMSNVYRGRMQKDCNIVLHERYKRKLPWKLVKVPLLIVISSVSKILPKNDHFKVTMYSNALLGVWPYIFAHNPLMHKLYNIYAKFIFVYFLLYIISTFIELLVLLSAEEIHVDKIIGNLSLSLFYPIIIIRVYIIRSKDIEDLIREAMELEEVIYKCGDEELIDIYRVNVHQSHVSNIALLVNVSLGTIFFIMHSLYVDENVEFNKATNTTRVIKEFSLSSWFPYDEQEHFLISYIWQMFNGTIGAAYFMYIDIFIFSLIIFPLGQIKILKHILANFDKYVLKTSNQLGCDRDEASFLTLRECIVKHKDIIRYINTYNDCMKNIMVLDFLQSSLQLASVVILLFLYEVQLYYIIYRGEFTFSMLIRLFIYYWYANEIMLQSSNIANAVWEGSWYEEPQKVKQMMLMMMMRSNKPLMLEIGPFKTMTLDSFLGILKATYSYMMIIYK